MKTSKDLEDTEKSILVDTLQSKKVCEGEIDDIDSEISKWQKQREIKVIELNKLREIETRHTIKNEKGK